MHILLTDVYITITMVKPGQLPNNSHLWLDIHKFWYMTTYSILLATFLDPKNAVEIM